MDISILVVDDNAITSTLIKQTLQNANYKVSTSVNGKAALDVVNSVHVDLIITDVIMPVMDGVDFYKALKNRERTKNIPIIVITDNKVFRESFAALGGVDDFIAKPIEAEELVAKVENVLNVIAQQKKKGRILMLGNDKDICHSMSHQLMRIGCKIIIARSSIDLIETALLSIPDIVLIDVLMKDLPTKETIKALRCFVSLSELKIFAYTNFSPEELSDFETVESLKEAKNACLEVGASKYIGRYTKTTFLQNFHEYWD